MKKRTFWVLPILAVLAVTGIFVVQRSPSGETERTRPEARQPPPRVLVTEAVKRTISEELELTGSVEPYRVARLASPAEGPVSDLRVREADHVEAGDALLSIGRREGVEAWIASLQEELRKEEDNLRITRQLVERDALPGAELDQARTSYERVRAQRVQAEEAARDHVVTAPWAGVISRVLVQEGEFVPPRTVLLEMYDPATLLIRAAVPERHAAGVRAGKRVGIRLDAYPEHMLEGRIERVYPYLDPVLRTRSVEILPEEPVDLLPGMFARLRVFLKTVDDAVVVPLRAVRSGPEGGFVFVVEDGKAVRRPVKTGIEEGGRVEIETGLSPGERVIVAGAEGLRDGDAVSPGPSEGASGQPPEPKRVR